jgi:dihydrofolate reductase
VIGGGEIYALAMEAADRVYVTDIEADVDADTFFPELHEKDWSEVERTSIARSEVNQYNGVLRTLDRVR